MAEQTKLETGKYIVFLACMMSVMFSPASYIFVTSVILQYGQDMFFLYLTLKFWPQCTLWTLKSSYAAGLIAL